MKFHHFHRFLPCKSHSHRSTRSHQDCSDLDSIIERLGLKVIGGTPQQYATVIHNELAKWTKLVKAAGIQPE